MSLFFRQILTLLTVPPGNFIYHIVLVFSIAVALLGAIQSLLAGNFPKERRTVTGLSILLGLQLVLFIASGLSWQGLLNPQLILPPLDRAVTLLTLVWIAWLWTFPEPMRMADAATLLLSLLGIAVLGLTLVLWAQRPTSSFNLSLFETVWQVFSLAVILLGFLGLIVRRPNGWTYGLVILILGFLGHFTSLIYPINGNFPGTVRLAQLAMFPILVTLSPRFRVSTQEEAPVLKSGKPVGRAQASERTTMDPKTFQALISIAAETDSTRIGQTLTHGIAQAMAADLCYLVTQGGDKSLAFLSGYDLFHEKNLPDILLDRESIPQLAKAVQRARPLRLPASNTPLDLKVLAQALSLANPGNLLCIPIPFPKDGPLTSVLILSPYSNKIWSAEDQIILSNVSSLFIPILERNQRSTALEIERDRSLKEAHNVMERAAEARKKYEQLANELESQRGITTQSQLQTIMYEEAQGTIEKLKEENYRLRHANDFSEAPGDQLEPRPQPFDLNEIIDDAMAHTSTQIREKNITLRLDLTSTAPHIQTDRDALQQILFQLLQNAAAATREEGNITLHIQIQNEQEHHYLFIQVADNGGGIATADIPRVFARRNPAENTIIQGLGNTGNGLSTTKALVEAQNGRIWIETEAGVGSTFSVLMPVGVGHPVES